MFFSYKVFLLISAKRVAELQHMLLTYNMQKTRQIVQLTVFVDYCLKNERKKQRYLESQH
ncbi:MAG: hypothetical protein ACI9QV_000706 [Methylophagaceae bacterium]|jgi:hypothetical protein